MSVFFHDRITYRIQYYLAEANFKLFAKEIEIVRGHEARESIEAMPDRGSHGVRKWQSY